MITWIEEVRALVQCKDVYYCNGTEDEKQVLLDNMVKDNMLFKLNDTLRPNSYLARSDPTDVARTESCTYVCTKSKSNAGINNNWEDPTTMKDKLNKLLNNCMKNKTLYVVPFVMGPLAHEWSLYGTLLTDSPYVVVNMHIMTTMGKEVFDYIVNNNVTFIKCIHSVCCEHDGSVGTDGNTLSLKWPSNKTKYIAHFPETLEIISLASGYGGNSILAKKCVALRIASYMGHYDSGTEGWLAEHMMLIGLQNNNDIKYIAGSFPSACGKTNLSMLKSQMPDWQIHTLGDDITWIRKKDDILYGMNPEKGFFGVAVNTNWKTNPYCMETIKHSTIFTNVALTENKDVWWEGLTEQVPENLIDWQGNLYVNNKNSFAAHQNARFTVSAKQCPIYINKDWVPLSAIIFGSKRKTLVPLVRQATSHVQGIYYGSTLMSEMTAAAEGTLGTLRYDPFSMLPFCGYDMSKYFKHWLTLVSTLPIFYVNWFRKDTHNQFIWPGFKENIRVLEWIYNRINQDDNYLYTPIGFIPKTLNMTHLHNVDLTQLFDINKQEWLEQLEKDYQYLTTYKDIPQELIMENERMKKKLQHM
jgi:phosphoenolpyruvate carboxykinase (GTP)